MTDFRLIDYLDHMKQAASEAIQFVAGQTPEQFRADRKTQRAVVMSPIVIGEASVRLAERYPDFVDRNPQIGWRNMRGMRNRIAHGYFDINLDIVWDTVTIALPTLVGQIEAAAKDVPDPQ